MARSIRSLISKTLFGADVKAMKQEHNNLVNEMEELKTAYALHQHAALNAAPSTQATLTATKANLFNP